MSTNSMKLSTAGIGAAAFAAALALALPAQANVVCGALLIADTTLTHDLNCTGDGLVIDADDITVNLDGFTITGDKNSTGDYGIDNTGGKDGVTIKKGQITSFGFGVRAEEAVDLTLSQLDISDNLRHGIFLIDTVGSEISQNHIWGNDRNGIRVDGDENVAVSENIDVFRNRVDNNGRHGISFRDAETVTITQNTVEDNGRHGIRVIDSADFFISQNTVSDNGQDGGTSDGKAGIRLLDTNDSDVIRNKVSDHVDTGIWLTDTVGTLVERNKVSGSGIDDLLEDGTSSGNDFVKNKCTTSSPGGLCV